MSSTELASETVELSKGMLGIIGAYGMHAAIDVRDLYPKIAAESPPPEPSLVSADTDTSEGVPPTASNKRRGARAAAAPARSRSRGASSPDS